jgi:hypothetical protein
VRIERFNKCAWLWAEVEGLFRLGRQPMGSAVPSIIKLQLTTMVIRAH